MYHPDRTTGAPPQADACGRDWAADATFRRVRWAMTAAWGTAVLLATAARAAVAHTLPVDLVPVASTALLLLMLIAVGRVSKGVPAAPAATPRAAGWPPVRVQRRIESRLTQPVSPLSSE